MTCVAITGGRDHRPTREEMDRFETLWNELGGTVLLHGACPSGVDRALLGWAMRHPDVLSNAYPAHWSLHGRAAGPIRNALMVREADALIAFPGGKGTANCVKQAQRKGIPVHFVNGGD